MNTNTPKFLGELMLWCFQWGCEVHLRDKAWHTPLQDPGSPYKFGEHHERMPDGTLVDLAHRLRRKTIQIPEVVFSRGEQHVSISAVDFEDLERHIKARYRQIFMELSVPMWPESKLS